MAHRKIQFLAVLLAAFVATGYARPPRKILNGENTSIMDFPYMAIVNAYDKPDKSVWYFCGGTIIDAKHIMTAAHCFYGSNSTIKSAEMFDVFTGIDDLNRLSNENLFKVLRVIPHLDYNRTGEVENDIGILELDGSLSFNDVRQPVELLNRNIGYGEEAIATGWGVMTASESAGLSRILQKITVTVFHPAICSSQGSWYPRSYNATICTIPQRSGGAGYGDSGGPLSFNGKLIGIASMSLCQPGGVVIFTRVHSYLSWIKSIIEE